MSYGINGSYAVTKKLILRSGISKLNLAYKTSNVLVYDYSDDTISLGTAPIAINTNNNIITSNVALIDKNSLEGDNVSAEYSDVLTSSDINQSLSYIAPLKCNRSAIVDHQSAK